MTKTTNTLPSVWSAWLALLLCIAANGVIFAQEQATLTPRRVHVAALAIPDTTFQAESEAFLRRLPALLYSATAAIQPCIPEADPAQAHNLLRLSLEPALPGWQLKLDLYEGPTQSLTHTLTLPGPEADPQLVHEFIQRVAPELAALLQPVPRPVSTEQLRYEENRSRIDERVAYSQSLNLPRELAISGSLQTFKFAMANGVEGPFRFVPQTINLAPLGLDMSWYNNNNVAFTVSLALAYNNSVAYFTSDRLEEKTIQNEGGGTTTYNIVHADSLVQSRNLGILAGLGVAVRSSGRLSSVFSASYYLGTVRTEITEDGIHYFGYAYSSELVLKQGDVHWLPTAYLALRQQYVFNITPHYFAGIGIELFFNPMVLLYAGGENNYYTIADSFLFFRLPALVCGYRF